MLIRCGICPVLKAGRCSPFSQPDFIIEIILLLHPIDIRLQELAGYFVSLNHWVLSHAFQRRSTHQSLVFLPSLLCDRPHFPRPRLGQSALYSDEDRVRRLHPLRLCHHR